MKTPTPYDPEDIESLMIHKSFDELYPEEREFVLRHVDNKTEYESMRLLLIELLDPSREDQWLEPDPSIRANLLAQFAREEKGGFRIWLNTLFASLNTPTQVWYQRPAVRLSFAGIAILIAVVLVLPKNETRLAELKKEENTSSAPAETVEEAADSLLPAAPSLVTPAIDAVQEESPTEQESTIRAVEPQIAESVATPTTNTTSEAALAEAKDAMKPKAESTDEVNEALLYDQFSATEEEFRVETLSTKSTTTFSSSTENLSVTEFTIAVVSASSSANLSKVGGLLDLLYTAR